MIIYKLRDSSYYKYSKNFLEKYNKLYISSIEIRNEKIVWIYNFEIENKLGDLDESIVYFIENNYLKNSKKLTLILPKK